MSNSQLLAQAVNQMVGLNRIINGACRIAQRGSIVCSAGVSGYGGPDRFLAVNANSAGGQFTQSQGTISFAGASNFAVVQTVNSPMTNSTGNNCWAGICQAIEGYNCFDLLGQPAVVSFIFDASRAGTYSFSIRDYATNNSFVTTFGYSTANSPQKITILIPTLPTSLSVPNSNAGGLLLNVGAINTSGVYQTSNIGSWQSGNFLYAAGSMNWSQAANDFIALTNLKLESGTKATIMEPRSFGEELLLCQRYYQSYGNTQFIGAGVCVSTSLAYVMINNAAGMRTIPSVVQSGTQLYCGSVVANVSSIGNNYSEPNGQVALGVNTSGLTIGQGAMWFTSGGTLTLSAEL